MKKLNLITKLLLLTFMTALVLSCDEEDNKTQDANLTYDQLTPEIKDFLSKHFANNPFSRAEKDSDSYDVELSNGNNGIIELDFTLNSVNYNIDSRTKIPDATVPPKILAYVTKNYPKSFITGWERNSVGYQDVEIDNSYDLEFDQNDDFYRIDSGGNGGATVPPSSTPVEISDYVTKHFPEYKVVTSIKDYDNYEVFLEDKNDRYNTAKLEFTLKFEIDKIETSTTLPDSVLQKAILDYIAANYAGSKAISWEIDDIKQEQDVELNNVARTDLVFDFDGKFIRIDY